MTHKGADFTSAPFSFMKAILNQRERELTSVAIDLFLKGTPEWRIAAHAHRLHFTDAQFSNYFDKLGGLSEDTKFAIHTHFRDIEKGQCHDKAIENGIKLGQWYMPQADLPANTEA